MRTPALRCGIERRNKALSAEGAEGIAARLAAETQPALAEGNDVPPCYRHACGKARQKQVEHRRARIHHAAGQTAYRRAVVKISDEEHCPGQNRRAVGDYPRAACAYPAGGVVVRIDAHPAGAEYEIGLFAAHFKDRVPDVLHAVAGADRCDCLYPVGFELFNDHGREGVVYDALFDLAAGGHDAGGLLYKRVQRHERFVPCGFLRLTELLILNDERDDPHPGKLVAPAHGSAALARGDHYILLGIDGKKSAAFHGEKPVAGGRKLYLALLDLTAQQVLVRAQGIKPLRRVVFMNHAGRHLIYIQVLLAH